ncbi:MAG: class I SAM-dependent methyltransferase [Promethearchaeota archaeon]
MGRYFEYDPDAVEMFCKWLEFLCKPSVKVLEVGAGTGFFSEILLQINPSMKLSCLEPDKQFIKVLQRKFKQQVTTIQGLIEDVKIPVELYDVVISHIVIHNLRNPVKALEGMKRMVRSGGFVVAIEPLAGRRHYLPSEELNQAFALLDEVKVFFWRQIVDTGDNPVNINPWQNNYPALFEEAGLRFLRCHGWTSVFTLSDDRYAFDERMKWNKMRQEALMSSREEITGILLDNGKKREEVNKAFEVISTYLKRIEGLTREELSKIHEQEIAHRIITIGFKD